MADIEALKKIAGIEACQFVKSGMKVGLGTGSTVTHTVIELGRRIAEEGLEIVGVPTSLATEKLAIEVGIPLVELSEIDGLDIVIDGADEYDPDFQLIKGGGAALTVGQGFTGQEQGRPRPADQVDYGNPGNRMYTRRLAK